MKFISHAAGAILEGALVALVILVLVVGTTFAAKGGKAGTGGSTGSSLSGPIVVSDPSRTPVYDDTITFNVSTTASQPEVGVRCWQGANWVLDAYAAYFETWMLTKDVTLTSNKWDPAADASCTARLFYYNKRGVEQVLAKVSFGVAP
jgi:hypothetical protein